MPTSRWGGQAPQCCPCSSRRNRTPRRPSCGAPFPMSAFASHCCCNKSAQTQWLKATHICYLVISVQEFQRPNGSAGLCSLGGARGEWFSDLPASRGTIVPCLVASSSIIKARSTASPNLSDSDPLTLLPSSHRLLSDSCLPLTRILVMKGPSDNQDYPLSQEPQCVTRTQSQGQGSECGH